MLQPPGAVPRARVLHPEVDGGAWAGFLERAAEHGHAPESALHGAFVLSLAALLGAPPALVGVHRGDGARAAAVPDTGDLAFTDWLRETEEAVARAVPVREEDPPPYVGVTAPGGASGPPPGTLLDCSPGGGGGRPRLWSVRPAVTDDAAEAVGEALARALRALAGREAWAAPARALVTAAPADAPGSPLVALEDALAEHSALRDARIQTEPGHDGPVLTAYLEPAPGTDPDADALRAHLRLRLPTAPVPERWCFVEHVVTGADGRVDTGALVPAANEASLRARLGELWARELGVAAVGAEDDFFALGGDSLTATRLLAAVRAELGADLDLGQTLRLLSAGSLREAARLLHARPRGGEVEALPEVEHRPQDRLEPFPLTDQQQAYALGRGDTFSSGNVACHTYMEFEGEGIDPERLRRAWERVVLRHDMLRGQVDAETLSQYIDPSLGTDHMVLVDLTGAGPDEVERVLERTRYDLSHRVAELSGAPLYDLVVLSLPGDRYRVCVGLDALVADLAGTGVLYTDLGRYYADPEAELEPVEVSFRDYVLAERRVVDGAAHRRAEEYWDGRVPELPPAPDLPLARDPAEITEPRFTPRASTVEADTWGRVKAEAAARGITSSGLLAACYAETLAGWSRSRHFTLNLPSFNRLPLHPDVARAVGEFASLILVEVDARHPEPFADFARGVQTQIWSDLGHQHVTGVEVLRELIRLRGGFGQAVMPFVFTSTTALAGDPTSLLDGALRRVYRVAQTPQVWLDLIVEESDGTLFVNWDSLEGLFPDGLMDDMSAAFLDLVASLADPEAWGRPARDPRPPEQVRRQAAMAGPDRGLPAEPAHAGFWRWSERTPDAPALITGEGTTTYGELADRAARIGGWLRRGGAAPDLPVAVVMGKGADQVAAVHGILASGSPYLPLDSEAPARRTAELLDRAGVAQVLTRTGDLDPDWARGRRVLEVDAVPGPGGPGGAGTDAGPGTSGGAHASVPAPGPGPEPVPETAPASAVPELVGGEPVSTSAVPEPVGGEPEPAPVSAPAPVDPEPVEPGAPAAVSPTAPTPVPVDPGHLAYVLFTSGSTGLPKGVMIEHRSVLNCVRETTEALGTGPGDRFLAVSAVHHDMSVYDLFGVLGSGAALVVPDADARRDAHQWARMVHEHRVTGWVSVPAMMEMLLESAGDGQLESLRTVVLGGDWVPPGAVRALRGAAPGVEVRSIGGPTETTVWNIWHPVREGDLAGRTIPYGRALANTRYHVLDEGLRDRPDLAVGELCCSGASLARGYWEDPDRTARAFTTHPATGERIYRTGDLGYFRPDGLIEFVGRDDFQIKVRGQRIETGEVEAALLDHPGVAACVVTGVAHRDRPGYRALAGYLVPAAGADPDPEEVGAHLARRLPAHMVPATLTVLAELPLNANGKLDRAALPDPEPRQDADAGSEEPRGPLEEVVAGLWERVLDVPVGREDDFFQLGGDSLLATRLVNLVREELPGTRPSLRDLFASPTVASSCAALAAGESDPERLTAVARMALEVAALDEAALDERLERMEDGGAQR